jgi:hypothetical protein
MRFSPVRYGSFPRDRDLFDGLETRRWNRTKSAFADWASTGLRMAGAGENRCVRGRGGMRHRR